MSHESLYTRITPERFMAELIEVWDLPEFTTNRKVFYSDSYGLTLVMLKGVDGDGILKRVASRLGFAYSVPEYWHLDFVMYSEPEKELWDRPVELSYSKERDRGSAMLDRSDSSVSQWAKRLDVIVEHENDCRTAWQEVNKLTQWRAGLRVLITHYSPRWINAEHRSQLLKLWERMLTGAGLEDDSFLIVLGRYDGNTIAWEQWESFVWRGGKLKELSVLPADKR